MTRLERFAIYQLKDTPETRKFRFRSYQLLQENGIRPKCGNYEKVYVGIMRPEDTPGRIRERFNRKLPKNLKGHSISISDVLVLHEDGNASAYYVETSDFIVIDGFFPKKSSGSKIAYGDRHVRIEGKGGTWYAFDTFVAEQRLFFLMEHEQYEKRAAWIVADEYGKVVADDVHNGFDQAVQKQLKEHVKQSQNKNVGSKTQTIEMKKPQGRPSVLAKLRQKQKRIAEDRKKTDLAKERSTKE